MEWNRVFHAPNAAIDSECDPFSKDDFMKHTAKKGMTAGEMMDLSKNLSEKREKARGLDPVKQKAVTKYEKKTNKAHPNKKQMKFSVFTPSHDLKNIDRALDSLVNQTFKDFEWVLLLNGDAEKDKESLSKKLESNNIKYKLVEFFQKDNKNIGYLNTSAVKTQAEKSS